MDYKNEIVMAPLNLDDEDLIYELYNNPLVTEYGFLNYKFPQSNLQIRKKIEKWISDQEKNKHLIIKYFDEDIGLAQIYNIDYINSKCSVGLLLKPKFFNKGIGGNVLKSLITICFNQINLHKIEVSVAEENQASINLITKLGFLQEGKLIDSLFHYGKYENILLFGLINENH